MSQITPWLVCRLRARKRFYLK